MYEEAYGKPNKTKRSGESTWSVELSKGMLVQAKSVFFLRRTIDEDQEESFCVVVLSVSLGYRLEKPSEK